jgi:hypothetical protein
MSWTLLALVPGFLVLVVFAIGLERSGEAGAATLFWFLASLFILIGVAVIL